MAFCCCGSEITLDQVSWKQPLLRWPPITKDTKAEVSLHILTICQGGANLPIWVILTSKEPSNQILSQDVEPWLLSSILSNSQALWPSDKVKIGSHFWASTPWDAPMCVLVPTSPYAISAACGPILLWAVYYWIYYASVEELGCCVCKTISTVLLEKYK